MPKETPAWSCENQRSDGESHPHPSKQTRWQCVFPLKRIKPVLHPSPILLSYHVHPPPPHPLGVPEPAARSRPSTRCRPCASAVYLARDPGRNPRGARSSACGEAPGGRSGGSGSSWGGAGTPRTSISQVIVLGHCSGNLPLFQHPLRQMSNR